MLKSHHLAIENDVRMRSIFFVDIQTHSIEYHHMVQEALSLCEREKIHYSKVSVHHILEAPLALRFAVDAYRGNSTHQNRRPDGYVVFGYVDQHEVLSGVVYEEALRSLQDVGCYYGLALSHTTLFEGEPLKKTPAEIAQNTLVSCLNLIDIKKQLGLNPQHMNHL